jgi:putative DNA primase/helicase
MRKDYFEFQPQFKLVIIGNHKPALRNVDDAARRRFNLIPFIHQPERPDKQLEEKLKIEYPAILNWMIQGCLDWQQYGLMRPDVVNEATQEYFEEQDLFGRWLEECCETWKFEGQFETAARLYKSWCDFSVSNGERFGTSKAFGTRLAQHGFKDDRKSIGGKTHKVWRGISLIRLEEERKPYAD